MSDYITIRQLADEFGIDPSNVRRYVKKHGFEPIKVRTPESRGQLTLAFTSEEAEAVREVRNSEGYWVKGSSATPSSNDTKGSFYIIQVIPEFAPNRVKLGFSNDANTRLNAHQTSAPTAKLIKCWPCKRAWERAAIDSITRLDCELIANEVYECGELADLIQRANDFFNVMPTA